MAHFEEGALLRKFGDEPGADVHRLVASILYGKDTADVTDDERTVAKTIGFGLLYGMGIPKLARDLGRSVDEAKVLKKKYMAALPGIKDLQDGLKDLAKAKEPAVTWGGREYYCEKAKVVDGRLRTFEYKLLNYLVQGSAADCTKQAILNYDAHPKRRGRFLLTVHDEVNFSCAPSAMAAEMRVLGECMADVDFDVPMLSDGATGPRWGDLTKWKE